MKAIGTFVMLVVAVYAASFVPFAHDAYPGFVTEVPTLRYTAENFPQDADDLNRDLKDACDHIPFLIRPIANKPDWVHLVAAQPDGSERSGDVDCETFEIRNTKDTPASN